MIFPPQDWTDEELDRLDMTPRGRSWAKCAISTTVLGGVFWGMLLAAIFFALGSWAAAQQDRIHWEQEYGG